LSGCGTTLQRRIEVQQLLFIERGKKYLKFALHIILICFLSSVLKPEILEVLEKYRDDELQKRREKRKKQDGDDKTKEDEKEENEANKTIEWTTPRSTSALHVSTFVHVSKLPQDPQIDWLYISRGLAPLSDVRPWCV
jgi:hypothetical protein